MDYQEKQDETSLSHRSQEWYLELLQNEIENLGQQQLSMDLRQQLKVDLESISKDEKGNSSVRIKIAHRLTDYLVQVDGESKELISWYADFLAVNGDTSMDPKDAIKLAELTAQLPDDAKLDWADYETQADRTVFRTRWCHEYKGLPVEGDYIEVLINARLNQPFAFTRIWRTPQL